MLLEKKPNLTIKNKKGLTAIDTAYNKTMISMFTLYLSNFSRKSSEEETKTQKSSPRYMENKSKNMKKIKEITEKIKIKEPSLPQKYEVKQKQKMRLIQGPKKHFEVLSFNYLVTLFI